MGQDIVSMTGDKEKYRGNTANAAGDSLGSGGDKRSINSRNGGSTEGPETGETVIASIEEVTAASGGRAPPIETWADMNGGRRENLKRAKARRFLRLKVEGKRHNCLPALESKKERVASTTEEQRKRVLVILARTSAKDVTTKDSSKKQAKIGMLEVECVG